MTEYYENVNHLVLNFYPDGYSIAVKLNEFPVFTSETVLETAKISYDETGLLDYIANEELPPVLVEMIDNSPKLSQYKIWRDGCLVLEVRDKIEPSTVANFFVLLKPTNLSMLYDVLNLTSSKYWSAQQRLQLESQIVLHNSPKLTLESDAVAQAQSRHSETDEANQPQVSLNDRFKKMYLNRPIQAVHAQNNGNQVSTHHPKMNNIYHNPGSRQTTIVADSLPTELILQQFIADRRAAREKSLPLVPRFHKRNVSYK